MLRQDDFFKSQLVLTGWRYGREYGGHQAACIVMSVLMNRVRAGWSPNVLHVIDNMPKFAASMEVPTGTPAVWEPEFVRLLHEVEPIFAGTKNWAQVKLGGVTGNQTANCMYFCDTRRIDTPFFKEKILGDPQAHPRGVNLNSLQTFL